MPLYEYKCLKCGKVFECLSKVDYVVLCPKCNVACKRVFPTGIGVQFKGSGFYETDYKGER